MYFFFKWLVRYSLIECLVDESWMIGRFDGMMVGGLDGRMIGWLDIWLNDLMVSC